MCTVNKKYSRIGNPRCKLTEFVILDVSGFFIPKSQY